MSWKNPPDSDRMVMMKPHFAHYNQNSRNASLKLPKAILSTTRNSQLATRNSQLITHNCTHNSLNRVKSYTNLQSLSLSKGSKRRPFDLIINIINIFSLFGKMPGLRIRGDTGFFYTQPKGVFV